MTDAEIDNISPKLEAAIKGPKDAFLSAFLLSFGVAKATVKKMEMAGTDGHGRYSIRQKMLFALVEAGGNVERAYLDAIEGRSRKERFVAATDFKRLMAKDMVSGLGMDIPFEELPARYEFFLPLCGREAIEPLEENPADVKAAAQMGRLFDAIKRDNEGCGELTEEALNVFLTRLIFCLFADYTHIFGHGQFRNVLQLHTAEDGSTVAAFLEGLFAALNTPLEERAGLKDYLLPFPYVNGGLFAKKLAIPAFSRSSRRSLLESSCIDWSGINPDIFGSMFQAVISQSQRRTLGQHYTSVPNIMKALSPLFIDELKAELSSIAAGAGAKKGALSDFRRRIAAIKVFDPACGSGNFLITAYKELCRLDMEAIRLGNELPFVGIRLENFYGIEIDGFACEIARLSLWLAEHQINMECFEAFGNANPTLPLADAGRIINANALAVDWSDACPAGDGTVFVCGNPPYAGHQTKTDAQRADIKKVFEGRIEGTTDLDYISCWFLKASDYIRGYGNRKLALVSTNSVVQGKHVSALWPAVLKDDEEIFFGYESFKWANNAKHNAGVTVTVIGVRNKCDEPKRIYSADGARVVQNISPYLRDEATLDTVRPSHKAPDGLPKCGHGVMAYDGGNLLFSTKEKNDFVKENPSAKCLFRKFIGGDEYIKGRERWCLWIDDDMLELAMSFPEVARRIEATRQMRLKSPDAAGHKLAAKPWQMREHPDISASCIIIPLVASERRDYIPMGYLVAGTVVSANAHAIYNAPLWLFAILTSRMHMAWVRAVGGRLETRYRYSSTLCYNTFPFPVLSDYHKKALEDAGAAILCTRENHYEQPLARLYNPPAMPHDLMEAHRLCDLLVDSIYRRSVFADDAERLEELFRRYRSFSS